MVLEVNEVTQGQVRTKGDRGLRIKLGDLAYSEGRRKVENCEEDRRNSQRGAGQSNRVNNQFDSRH